MTRLFARSPHAIASAADWRFLGARAQVLRFTIELAFYSLFSKKKSCFNAILLLGVYWFTLHRRRHRKCTLGLGRWTFTNNASLQTTRARMYAKRANLWIDGGHERDLESLQQKGSLKDPPFRTCWLYEVDSTFIKSINAANFKPTTKLQKQITKLILSEKLGFFRQTHNYCIFITTRLYFW